MKILWIIRISVIFFVFAGHAQTMMYTVWQIGIHDQSPKEFALYDSGYRQYNEKFKKDVLYEIGVSKEKTDFPLVLPGPYDNSWAGFGPKQIYIRFGIDQLESGCTAKLTLYFTEVHPIGPPVLNININNFESKLQTPKGENQNYLDNYQTGSRDLKVALDIPSGVLKKGSNLLVIRNESGSWCVFDNITMETDSPVKIGKLSNSEISAVPDVIPALVYGKNGELRQPINLTTINWGGEQVADAFVDGQSIGKYTITKGSGQMHISVPEVKAEKEINVRLVSQSKELCNTQVKVFPVKKWTLYLVQHTHTDIGYTKPQTEILAEHLRYIDYAVDYCEMTKDYPDDSKFRWTCESSWAVREYLESRPKEQVERFLKCIKDGQIEVCGMFFNMSELADENSLRAFLEPIREIKKAGIPVVTAMQDDVNGIAWCLADYLPDLGVKYFTMGENATRALLPFDKPTLYKWQSPSGKQLYSFRSDHYMTGNFWKIDKANTIDDFAPGVFKYLKDLEEKQYPFDAISVQYSGYNTDNSPPSKREADLIRKWNEKYVFPKLRSALIHEFMDYATAKYNSELPVYRMAYPDWWTDGFGSAARETAASRKTHSDMITIQGMLSMAVAKGEALPDRIIDKINHVHENLLFYDEHTFGAAESISDPAGENSEVQWAEKESYVWDALKNAQGLYETSAGLMQPYISQGEKPTVTFFNALNWTRSGMVEVFIDHDLIPQGKAFKIIDDQGKIMEAQPVRSRSEGTYYAIYAENIPAMGYRTFQIVTEPEDRAQMPPIASDNKLENSFYTITFDSQKGAIKSLYDKELQLEMVDNVSPWQLGAFIYETVKNRDELTDYNRKGLTDVQIKQGTNGPIYQNLYIEGKSACCEDGFGVRIEVRLFHHEKRIELDYAINKIPNTNPNAIYVAFPFKLDKAKLCFDVQGGVLYSGENQIDGTASDWNTVQNFASARNENAQFIVGSNTIPLFQMGGINTGKYQRKNIYEKPYVYSWVMNNYWFTNFRASQEGELHWSYYLTSSKNGSNTQATKFGWESRVPMYARVMPEGKPNGLTASYSAFHFNKDNFLMTSATPSKDKGFILINVRELDGKQTPFQILDNTGKPLDFSVVNVIEESITNNVCEINFNPFDNKFIKIKF